MTSNSAFTAATEADRHFQIEGGLGTVQGALTLARIHLSGDAEIERDAMQALSASFALCEQALRGVAGEIEANGGAVAIITAVMVMAAELRLHVGVAQLFDEGCFAQTDLSLALSSITERISDIIEELVETPPAMAA